MKGRFALYVAAAALSAACQSKPAPEAPKPQPGPAATKPAPDIKGLKLGASKADVLALFPEADCKRVEVETQCYVPHVSYGGSDSAAIFVRINDEGAKMIQVRHLDKIEFDYMVRGMVAKFGPPTNPLSPADLAHAAHVGWLTDTKQLIAIRSLEGISESRVMLIDAQWMRTKDAAKNRVPLIVPDFDGLKLGATQREVMALFPQATCEDKDDGLTICSAYGVRLGETVKAGVLLYLLSGSTQRVDVFLLPFQFDDMTTFLVGKFGPPRNDPRILTDNLKMWAEGDWILKAERLYNKTLSRVSLTSKVWRDEDARHKVAEAAEDI